MFGFSFLDKMSLSVRVHLEACKGTGWGAGQAPASSPGCPEPQIRKGDGAMVSQGWCSTS